MDAKNKVTLKRDPSGKWQPLKPGTTFTKREHDNRYLAKKRQEKIQAGTLMPHGAEQGNTNGFRHGAYSLLAMRTKGGKPKGNTALGRDLGQGSANTCKTWVVKTMRRWQSASWPMTARGVTS